MILLVYPLLQCTAFHGGRFYSDNAKFTLRTSASSVSAAAAAAAAAQRAMRCATRARGDSASTRSRGLGAPGPPWRCATFPCTTGDVASPSSLLTRAELQLAGAACTWQCVAPAAPRALPLRHCQWQPRQCAAWGYCSCSCSRRWRAARVARLRVSRMHIALGGHDSACSCSCARTRGRPAC